MACSGFFVLPTTHMSLLAMVAIAEGLLRCALLDTVLQEGPQTRLFASGPTNNSKRLAAKSPTIGANTPRKPVPVILAPPLFLECCLSEATRTDPCAEPRALHLPLMAMVGVTRYRVVTW
jgi:hypothetical protein